MSNIAIPSRTLRSSVSTQNTSKRMTKESSLTVYQDENFGLGQKKTTMASKTFAVHKDEPNKAALKPKRAPLAPRTTNNIVIQKPAQKSKAPCENAKSQKPKIETTIDDLTLRVDSMEIETSALPKTNKPFVFVPPSMPMPQLPMPSMPTPVFSFEENEICDLSTSLDDVEDIDECDHHDPSFATEYVDEIFKWMKEKEKLNPIQDYMIEQAEISKKHRTILVDWMAEVGVKYKLSSETLFMAVQLLDRYLQVKTVTREKIQLVGVTAMMIASKYEEIYSPEVQDWTWITADAYRKDQILQMEKSILIALDWSMTVPNCLHFLRRYSKAARSNSEIHTLSKYLCELSLVDYDFTQYPPSMVAAAAVYLARGCVWNKTLQFYTQFQEHQLVSLAKALKNLHQAQLSAVKCNSLFKKYASDKLFSVSRYQF